MSALLPCPFCGKAPKSQWQECNSPGMEDCGYWGIDCCQSFSHADDEPEATAAWNQRATPAEVAALRAEVERLRKTLERIANHPEANVVLTDYGPDGKQRVWPTVEQEARAALTHKEPGNEG